MWGSVDRHVSPWAGPAGDTHMLGARGSGHVLLPGYLPGSGIGCFQLQMTNHNYIYNRFTISFG